MYTYTVPSGVYQVSVTVIGGGGSGGYGGSAGDQNGGASAGGTGGGGGSGYVQTYVISVTPRQNYTVTVGGNGAASSFSSYSANGGGTGGTGGSYGVSGSAGIGRNNGQHNYGYGANNPGGAGYLGYGAGGAGGYGSVWYPENSPISPSAGSSGQSGAVIVLYPDFTEQFTTTNMQTGSAISGLNLYIADQNSTFSTNITSPADVMVYSGHTYEIEAYGTGYITNISYVKFTGSATFNTLMAPRLWNTFHVADPNGNPVPNYELIIDDYTDSDLFDYTNVNGDFSTYMGYNEIYGVQAKCPGYYDSDNLGFTVLGAKTYNLTLSPVGSSYIVPVAVVNSTSYCYINNSQLTVQDVANGQQWQYNVPAGVINVTLVQGHTYDFTVSSTGYYSNSSTEVTIHNANRITIGLNPVVLGQPTPDPTPMPTHLPDLSISGSDISFEKVT